MMGEYPELPPALIAQLHEQWLSRPEPAEADLPTFDSYGTF